MGAGDKPVIRMSFVFFDNSAVAVVNALQADLLVSTFSTIFRTFATLPQFSVATLISAAVDVVSFAVSSENSLTAPKLTQAVKCKTASSRTVILTNRIRHIPSSLRLRKGGPFTLVLSLRA